MQIDNRKKIILAVLVVILVIVGVVALRRSLGSGGGSVTVEDAIEAPTPPLDNPQEIPRLPE